jgi:hypothetical protein
MVSCIRLLQYKYTSFSLLVFRASRNLQMNEWRQLAAHSLIPRATTART